MSMQDPIADMLTRIRNAVNAGLSKVDVKRSNICLGIATVLKDEGYIQDVQPIEDAKQGILRVSLKYGPQGEKLINEIDRVSKPGRRVYNSMDDLPRVLDGLGITVVSTSQGVLSDRQCRQRHIGGEVLCRVS
ncbi:MAG: 30S ribosomal protein S8 [Phycisphaerae bacterium]|nr:30S ribosomal protein S8 [Phycisphaerae bacterium]